MRHLATNACLGLLTLAAGCSDSSSPTGDPPLTTPPDLVATVDRVSHEGGNGPNGRYSQYVLYVTVPPGTKSNAGLVLDRTTAVFFPSSAAAVSGSAADVRAGDQLEVWVEDGAIYGSVEAPPLAPAYFVKQVEVERR